MGMGSSDINLKLEKYRSKFQSQEFWVEIDLGRDNIGSR